MKKEAKDMHFNDVWDLPFKSDPSTKLSIYVWDNNSNVCFNYLGGSYDLYTRIIALLNGEEAEPFKTVVSNNDYILVSDTIYSEVLSTVLMVRGWGHLTGCGALHLPAEEAKRIQMELVDYAVQKLQGIK